MGSTRMVRFAAAFVSLALLIAGCAGSKQPQTQPATGQNTQPTTQAVEGVTDKEIVLGTWQPVTGNAAAWSVIGYNAKGYFDYINDTKGGVNGRKIRLQIEDDAYTGNLTKAAVKKLMEKDHVFAFCCGVGTASGSAVLDDIKNAKIPNIAPSTGSGKWNAPPYYFGWWINYTTEGRILAKYGVQTLKLKKFAIFYQNDDFGKEGMNAAKEAVVKLGGQVVAEVPYNATDNDLSAPAVAIQKSGAEAVMMWPTVKAAGQMMNELEKLSFKPKYLLSATAMNADTIKLAPTASQGAYAVWYLPMPDDASNQYVKEWQQAFPKYGGKPENMNAFGLIGWGEARMIVHALELAGKDLNRDKLIQAMESLKDWKDMATVSYSPTDRVGIREGFLVQAKGDKWEKVTDNISSDLN